MDIINPQWEAIASFFTVEVDAPKKVGRPCKHHPRDILNGILSLRRYARRWKVERLFAWLQNSRKLIVR